MIRNVTHNDYDALLEFTQAVPAFKTQVFNNCDYNRIRRTFTICVTCGFAKIVEHEDKIVGCMFGMIQTNYWGANVAFDIMNYSTRETPQLLRKFSNWAKDNNASQVILGNSYGSERLTRLIKKLGFTEDTSTFTRRF